MPQIHNVRFRALLLNNEPEEIDGINWVGECRRPRERSSVAKLSPAQCRHRCPWTCQNQLALPAAPRAPPAGVGRMKYRVGGRAILLTRWPDLVRPRAMYRS